MGDNEFKYPVLKINSSEDSDGGDTDDSNESNTVNAAISYGADRLSFGEDITGYIGDVIDSLVVYTSVDGNIASLDITSSNVDVVEIGTIEIGVGDYITSENEHIATIPLTADMLLTIFAIVKYAVISNSIMHTSLWLELNFCSYICQ